MGEVVQFRDYRRQEPRDLVSGITVGFISAGAITVHIPMEFPDGVWVDTAPSEYVAQPDDCA